MAALPQRIEELLKAFPEVEAEIVHDVLTTYENNLQDTHAALCAMFSSSSSSAVELPVRKTDREMMNEWAHPDRELPAPFANLAATICFVPDLMRSSRMDEKFAMLDAKVAARSRQRRNDSFASAAARLVQCAFGLRSPQAAKKFVGSDPGGLAHGNFYDGCRRVYDELEPWQKPLLEAAIDELMTIGDRDGLQIICGLLLRASQECQARKQFAFSVVVDRSITTTTTTANRHAETVGDDDLARSKKQLMDATRTVVDELKTLAFRSTFTEPTKLYFRAVHDFTMEGDVDVHGSNTYLAVLLATMGVKLAQTPFLGDEVKGIAPFQDGLPKRDLDRLWALENVGKSWECVLGGGGRHCPTVRRPVQHNLFFFPGDTAREVAVRCLQHDVQQQQQTAKAVERLLPYLAAFASHFSVHVAVERLCNAFLANDSVHNDLNVLFRAVVVDAEIVNDADSSWKSWLWDVETFAFRHDRALRLLRVAGIIVN